VVASANGQICGFVVAYRPPNQPVVIFVWQIGVAASGRGHGLGRRMLHHLVGSPACEGVRFMEATVTPSNVASQRLFKGFADALSVPLHVEPGFAPTDFGAQVHEDEMLYRIGPL
jgi:L-2,4-diaminobutyric acid acetyltransferase